MTRAEAHKALVTSPGCGAQAVRSAYRERLKEWHPDLNPSPEAHARTQEINDAFRLVCDEPLRVHARKGGKTACSTYVELSGFMDSETIGVIADIVASGLFGKEILMDAIMEMMPDDIRREYARTSEEGDGAVRRGGSDPVRESEGWGQGRTRGGRARG